MKIQDNQSITKVTDKNGNDIPFYDDGYGPLYVYHDQCGHFSFVAGIVRARSFETAYEIVEDEFLPEADESLEEIIKEYGFRRDHVKIMRSPVGVEFIADGSPLDTACVFVRWETVETPDPEAWPENELFQEAFTFRPNGPKTGDVHKHGIASKNLDGVHLREVGDEDAEEFTIEIATED